MSSAAAEALSVVLIAAVLGFAVLRPRGLPEAVVAVPAAAVVLTGAISLDQFRAQPNGWDRWSASSPRSWCWHGNATRGAVPGLRCLDGPFE